jgi:branched-chain amino acid transport system substrate-binding protein
MEERAMMKYVRRQVLALAGAAALASVAGFAQAQDGNLKFWVPLPLTGPLAVTGQAQQVGWQHAVDWINKDGGVKGRNIAIEFYDDEYKVELGVAGFKKAVADGDVVFSGGDGTPFVRAISPENNETYKVLMSSTGAASDLVDTARYPLHFLVGSNYSDQIRQLFNYIKAKDAGNKVAIVYSASEFGRDPLENTRTYAAEMGIDIVLEQETKFVEVDVTSHAIQVRQARPDYVIFHGYAANVWPEVVKLLRDYGVEAQMMGTIFGSHPDVVSTVGDAANGYLGTVTVNLLTEQTDTPMMNIIDDYLKTWTAKPYTGYANIGYMQSWATALLLREAIGSAIDKNVELNGPNLITEMAAIKDFDGDGVFGAPISFENNRIPYGVLYRYNIEGGKLTVTEETPWGRIE